MTTIYLLFALFVVLQIGDAVSTIAAIKRGGTEANPVMAKIMGKLGVVPTLVVMKLFAVAVVGWIVWQGWMLDWLLALVCAFYLAVVANNIIQYRKSR